MIHKLGKLKKFQAGNGRLLPKLVYGQDAALLNVLGTARATGLEQDLMVESQQMKRDQQRLQKEQAELQNTLAREKFDYKQERDLMLDDRYNQALKVAEENTQWDRDLVINNQLKSYRDAYTGLKINVSDQPKVDAIAADMGLLNEDGELSFGKINDQNGLRTAAAKYAKFTNLIKPLVKAGEETSRLGTTMNTLLNEYYKNKGNPVNIGKINTEESDVLAKELQDLYREITTNSDADPNLMQEFSSKVSDFEVVQSDYQKALQESALKESELKLKEINFNIKEKERATSIKEEKAKLWQKNQSGKLSDLKYKEAVEKINLLDIQYQKLMQSNSEKSNKPLTEAELEKNQVIRIMKNENVSELEAVRLLAKANKGEGKDKDKSLSNYTNVIVDKEGYTSNTGSGVIVNNAGGMKLQNIIEDFKGTDTPGSYENFIMFDTPAQDLTGEVGDKTETNFTPLPNGEWSLTTNNVNLYAKLHGLGDPSSWDKEKWESVDIENGMFKVEASDIGTPRAAGEQPGLNGVPPDAYVVDGPNRSLYSHINKIIFNRPNIIKDKEEELDFYRNKLNIEFADMTGGPEKQFTGLKQHAKDAISVMAPLMNRYNVLFTSGKREMNAGHGGNTGHARGEKADMQIVVNGSHFKNNPEKYEKQVNLQKDYLNDFKYLIETSGGRVDILDSVAPDDLTYVFNFNENGKKIYWKARIHKSIDANNNKTGTSHIDWDFGKEGATIPNIGIKEVN